MVVTYKHKILLSKTQQSRLSIVENLPSLNTRPLYHRLSFRLQSLFLPRPFFIPLLPISPTPDLSSFSQNGSPDLHKYRTKKDFYQTLPNVVFYTRYFNCLTRIHLLHSSAPFLRLYD